MTNGGNIRVTIVLSKAEHRNLILWSKYHGKAKSTYGGQIVGARIEANLSKIKELVADEAKTRGISSEELEELWLREEGYYSEPEIDED